MINILRDVKIMQKMVCIVIFLLHSHVFAQQPQTIFTVGVVPQFSNTKIHQIWAPVLKYLKQQTGFDFILKGAATIPIFEHEFNAGIFDFVYMNPYHVLLASKSQGYIPLIRDVGKDLYGIVVVKKDSHYQSIADLNNNKFAFPAPNALAASLMIRSDLKEKFGLAIKPVYVKTHSSVYLNVIMGLTPAGGGVQKTLQNQPAFIRNALRILYKTRQVATHPFVSHPRVLSSVREKVKQALLDLGNQPSGQKILSNIPIHKIGSASISDYQDLGNMGLDKLYQAN